MSYKTGGFKTKYRESYGYFYEDYIIYCAVESVSDTCVYKMFDVSGKEHDISISAEDDTEAFGKYSLIDCLYHLKHHENKTYSHHECDIIIEEMTEEEMSRIFNH